MTIYELECFLTVAEQLSFAKASAIMRISQPAISYQISALEKELETRLFERTTRSCRLTAAGQAFYQDMQHMMVFYRQAVQRVHDIDAAHRARLTIGIRKLFDYDSLSEMVMALRQRLPMTDPQILPHNDSAPLEDLRSGHIDIGFCYSCEHTDVADMKFHPLYTLHYYVLVNPSHPLADKASISFSDLKGFPVVTGGSAGNFLSACAGNTLERLQEAGADLSMSVPSYESALILIRSNLAAAILPILEHTHIPGMRKVPISDCETVDMELCCLRNDRRLTVKTFVEIAQEQFHIV